LGPAFEVKVTLRCQPLQLDPQAPYVLGLAEFGELDLGVRRLLAQLFSLRGKLCA
jgi:hypothetical protein